MSELIARGVRSHATQLRHLAEHSAGGRVEYTDSYVFFAGGHDYPGTQTNGVLRTSSTIGAAELLARADQFFGAMSRQYYLWTEQHGDADLAVEAHRRGLRLRPPEDGIPCIARTEPIAPLIVPASFRVETADNDAERLEYVRLAARTYGLAGASDELAEAVLFSVESLRDARVLLARDPTGHACSGIAVFLFGECVSIGSTVTDPVARGRGLASLLMQRATSWGFEQGARCAWGTASQQGIGTWHRLGFSVPTRFQRFLASPPDAASAGGTPSRRGQARPARASSRALPSRGA